MKKRTQVGVKQHSILRMFFVNYCNYRDGIAIIVKNTVTLSATLDGTTDQAIIYIPDSFAAYGRNWG